MITPQYAFFFYNKKSQWRRLKDESQTSVPLVKLRYQKGHRIEHDQRPSPQTLIKEYVCLIWRRARLTLGCRGIKTY